MVVADAVLVDVVHGEAAGLAVVLPVARALDGAVARSLDDGEGDGLGLDRKMILKKKKQRESNEAGAAKACFVLMLCKIVSKREWSHLEMIHEVYIHMEI